MADVPTKSSTTSSSRPQAEAGASGADLDFSNFKRRVRERTGIDLDSYKPEQMRRRLASLRSRTGVRSFTEYFHVIDRDPERMLEFLDFFTINVSEFYRNPEKWELLRREVLPRLLRARSSLRVWSAACSYGAEPYTIALVLNEIAPSARPYILATDIDRRMLERARAADSYTAQDVRNVPKGVLERHFKQVGDRYALEGRLRSVVTFRLHDLLKDPFESDFDLIVCRNVVIYFTEEAKQKLYRRLYDALAPGGFLFMGGTEIVASASAIGFTSELLSFYKK